MPRSHGSLRIASVCRTLPTPENGVTGTFVASRLAALAKLASVRILQPVPYFPAVRPLPAWVNGVERSVEGVPVDSVPMFYVPGVLKALDGRWLARCTQRKLRALDSQNWRADVLDAHFGYPDGVGCVHVAQALGLPVFVTIRGSETEFLREPAIRKQIVHALNAATDCISVSHSLRNVVAEHGVDAAKVRVIPNAVDRKRFRPGPKAAARNELGVEAGAKLIVSVGHLVARKGHHVLIRAAHRLMQNDPAVRLVIIGGPVYERTYPSELEQLVRDLNLDARVELLGLLDQETTGCWLRAADVFGLATSREGCCNAVLEALASGAPVVTTQAGDNAYFVRDGLNGFIAPIGDIDGFARALERALGRSWDAEHISHALEVGNWDDVANRVLGFMDERLAAEQHSS